MPHNPLSPSASPPFSRTSSGGIIWCGARPSLGQQLMESSVSDAGPISMPAALGRGCLRESAVHVCCLRGSRALLCTLVGAANQTAARRRRACRALHGTYWNGSPPRSHHVALPSPSSPLSVPDPGRYLSRVHLLRHRALYRLGPRDLRIFFCCECHDELADGRPNAGYHTWGWRRRPRRGPR